MKTYTFISVFFFIIGSSVLLAQNNKQCKVLQLITMIQKEDIETSEYRNELVFDIVGSKCLLKLLNKMENDTLLQNRICLELENPVADTINLQLRLDNLSAMPIEHQKLCKKMKESINRAILKNQ